MRRQRDADKADDGKDDARAGDAEIFRGCVVVIGWLWIGPWEDAHEDEKVEGGAEGYEEACCGEGSVEP